MKYELESEGSKGFKKLKRAALLSHISLLTGTTTTRTCTEGTRYLLSAVAKHAEVPVS